MNHSLGAFSLQFDSSGTLVRLAIPGVTPFLYDGTHREELAPGRLFITRGWDECFPTIEPHGESPVMGDLLWMSPRLIADTACIYQEWTTARYTATRRFCPLDPQRLEMTFKVVNRSAVPLPFLWASHALFSLDGLRRVQSAGCAMLDDFRLDGSSTKCFWPNRGMLHVHRQDCEVILESDQPWWGIWFNRGGWPAHRPAGIGCLGLEATTAAADKPGVEAIAPQEVFQGFVRLDVRC